MTANELRDKFLKFFESKGHTIISSASLVPENDPSVLFTTAGMHPLVPYLLGEKHPGGQRLVDVQKCIRTGDIDEVGDDRHLTFFEMLGNWSLGDYFKKEAITWSFEFLISPAWLGIDPRRLAVTVFAGDESAPRDEESAGIWKSLGILEERIAYLGANDNWWPAGGKHAGPQGPDTEMFYWTGDGPAPKVYDPKDARWVEIWNDVFMQFAKGGDDVLKPLAKKNVDTGMGLERTLAVLNGKKTVFETELFLPLIGVVEQLSGQRYGTDADKTKSFRIIADHLKAAAFILGDPWGVVPSNVDQGYVLRRLIRRAIRHARRLGVAGEFCWQVAQHVITMYEHAYPELSARRGIIKTELEKEEAKFAATLEDGLRELNKLLRVGEIELIKEGNEPPVLNRVDAEKAFYIFQTFGFPLEMMQEELGKRALLIDESEFRQQFIKHQELSRAGAAEKFAGGLADHSIESTMLHTATHLLHKALRDVLGNHVEQRGSNITHERLRFDFSHSDKMTSEQIKKVEDIVNEQIKRDLPISFEELTVEEAKKRGAIGLFEEKYGHKVKVYTMGDFSKEICGGPHVEHTGVLKSFKIQKEEASSAGIRRIKAIVGGLLEK